MRTILIWSFVAVCCGLSLPAQGSQGADFAERFALAEDRASVMQQLVPGTGDYFYYSCLHLQQTGRFDEVEPLLESWQRLHGRELRTIEIEHRQALLRFDRDPAAAYAYLQRQLELRFDRQREATGQRSELPTRLDPEVLSPSRLRQRALTMHPDSLDGFKDRALPDLARADLNDALLLQLLRRLERPDVSNLSALVHRQLALANQASFGSLGIHDNLTLAQLEELAQLQPGLLNNASFLGNYVQRLAPPAGVDLDQDEVLREAYLQRLWSFAQRLQPSQNGFKARVLHHYIAFDLARDRLDMERLQAYLRLPRRAAFVNPEFQQRSRRAEFVEQGTEIVSALPSLGDEEALIRECFMRIFQTEDRVAPYAQFVRQEWLERVLAETRLLAGDPDSTRWYALLDDPSAYQRIVDRVELRFPRNAKRYLDVSAPVSIGLDVKNVQQLLVKVYAIDAWSYCKAMGREVDATIDLDGVQPNREQLYRYEEPALRRVRRVFDFPGLQGAGTWVIEFVGNGMSSRAVVQKGRLVAMERIGAAGTVLTVLDEKGAEVQDAVAWLAGREYAADESGEILIPFAADEKRSTLILGRGSMATVQEFLHRSEDYRLDAGVFVERETLVAGRQAVLLVRPQLSIQGRVVSPSLLEEVELQFRGIRIDGTESLQTVQMPRWEAEGEYEHRFTVPDRLQTLMLTMTAKVEKVSDGSKAELSAPLASFTVNGIDRTSLIHQSLFGRDADGWFVEVRGRTGEPVPGRAIALQLTHRDYTDPIPVGLATDDTGRIQLGELPGIESVSMPMAPEEQGTVGWWGLETASAPRPRLVTGAVGESLRVPIATASTSISLFEMRNGRPYRDASASVTLQSGFAALDGLTAGDYALWIDGQRTLVWVAEGRRDGPRIVGPNRVLAVAGRNALQVVSAETSDKELAIRLGHASDAARVHVVATRYLPMFAPSQRLSVTPDQQWHDPVALLLGESQYSAGRQLADELRYVLERRYAARYPGNMLGRPSLLLNPWRPQDPWNEAQGLGGGAGGRFGGRGRGGAAAGGGPAAPGPAGPVTGSSAAYANLDFLPEVSLTLANLKPGADGFVRVPLAELAGCGFVQVVAVDRSDTAQTSVVLPGQALEPRDLTLRTGLDPEQHFTQQRRIDFIAPGGEAVIGDTRTAEAQSLATLGDVFRVMQSLVGSAPAPGSGFVQVDRDLGQFEFLVRWPELSEEQRREFYRTHGGHEFHFFVYHKDRDWFDAVVRPMLTAKVHKTFLDHWLLGDDLSAFLAPYAFGQLNLVEQILLLQRTPGQQGSLRRFVREQGELLPVAVDADKRLFGFTLASGEMDAGDPTRDYTGAPDGKVITGGADFYLGRLFRANNEKQDAPQAGGGAAKAGRPAVRRALTADREAGAAPAPAQSPEPMPELQAAERLQEAEDVALRFVSVQQQLQDKDLSRRKNKVQVWRAPDPTRRYVERNYWNLTVDAAAALEIPASQFWREFAQADSGQPFVSSHFAQATNSLNEAMLALALLDLPFVAEEMEAEQQDGRLTLRPRSPLLLVRSELLPAEEAAGEDPVLVRQDHFRLDDRYVYEGSERRTKYVRNEFLTGVAYGCQVVVTNPTATPRRVELLLQIPSGAIALNGSRATNSQPVVLGAFATATAEYAYYFPHVGENDHFPVHIASDGAFLAAAAPMKLRSVEVLEQVDAASWGHVSQNASEQVLLEWLGSANLQRVDLSRIEWRLRDKEFFSELVTLLRANHVYHDGVWSYAVLHQDRKATREYLEHQEGFVSRCGAWLQSPLLDIDPVARRAYEHAEFMPLYHSRAHQIGIWRRIPNQTVAVEWQALLNVMASMPRPDATTLAGATYFLLLQNRIDDALAVFGRIDPQQLPGRLQHDYMSAYLDFYTENLDEARRIAERYGDYPVERWRLMFAQILQQLDEAQGGDVAITDPRDRDQQQVAQAAAMPSLELAVEDGRILIRHGNVSACELRYHLLDVEFAFSTSPFAEQGASAVSYVMPRLKQQVALAADREVTEVPLPEQFRTGNVVVEARAGGVTRRVTHLASAMTVQIAESMGQLQVVAKDGGQLLPRVYVKVFARLPDGSVRFHKDGYTDLRGRFDYASVSEKGTENAERFALLVLSDKDGAVVRDVVGMQ